MADLTVAGLQADLFGKFNAEGSEVTVLREGEKPLGIGVIDSWEVLRVAPHAASNTGADIGVVWRQIGFLEGGMHFVHVTRFSKFEKTDDNLLLTRAIDGNVLQVDFIGPGSSARDMWDRFQQQKAGHAKEYAEYYASSEAQLAADANAI